MTTRIATIIRIDFDNMENRAENARSETELATFIDDGFPVFGKIKAFFAEYAAPKLYLGWDGQVYPRFEVRRRTAT